MPTTNHMYLTDAIGIGIQWVEVVSETPKMFVIRKNGRPVGCTERHHKTSLRIHPTYDAARIALIDREDRAAAAALRLAVHHEQRKLQARQLKEI